MCKLTWSLFLSAFLTLSLAGCAQRREFTEEEKRTLLKGVETIKIVVDESYYDGSRDFRIPAEKVSSTFKTYDKAQAILEGIGLKVALNENEPFDAVLSVKAEGYAESSGYAGGGYKCYTGARRSGEIILKKEEKPLISKHFESHASSPEKVLARDCSSQPASAPFEEPFEPKRNGFENQLFNLIIEYWGAERLSPLVESYPYFAFLGVNPRRNFVYEALAKNNIPAPCPAPMAWFFILPPILVLYTTVNIFMPKQKSIRKILFSFLALALVISIFSILSHFVYVGFTNLWSVTLQTLLILIAFACVGNEIANENEEVQV